MSSLHGITDERLMQIVDSFIASDFKASKARDRCNELWRLHRAGFSITREQVYPAFKMAFERGLIRVSPPYNQALAQRIADKFDVVPTDVRVATARKNLRHVASCAADVVVELIRVLATQKKRVHIGLGAGRTTLLIAQFLAQALRVERDLPALTFHALTAGFDVKEPLKTPLAYFGYFQYAGLDCEFRDMPAPPVVKWNRYDEVIQGPVVRDSFAERDEIDIVVTSLASVKDEHGDLNRFLEVGAATRPATFANVVGDVLYNPFTANAPMTWRGGERAVALFDLDELKALAEKDGKYVVLVSGPCGKCGETRTDALRPLVEKPRLKVWTHLVTDLPTGEELVDPKQEPRAAA